MAILDVARAWNQQGYSTIPIRFYDKRPDARKLPGGKWELFQQQLPTDFDLQQMFASQLQNIALIIGNGLVVIDFDVQDVFDYWFSLFPLQTYMVKTRRGMHVYFKTIQPAKNYHSALLDIKAERGYVLIPPSIHPSGYQYQVFMQAPVLRIDRLADVLPESFMPKPERTPTVAQEQQDHDIWDLVDNPRPEIGAGAVAKIRQSISILDLIPTAECSSSDGRWYSALCPFHADHRPSFWIDTTRGLCGCRTCNVKEMDVINLYARLHNLDLKTALSILSHQQQGNPT